MVESLKNHQKSQKREKRAKKAQFLINGMMALPGINEELEDGSEVYGGWSQPEGSTK